jgi:hypothetical protein
MADSGATGPLDRGAKKQLAIGEFSEANRLTSVSILDLRAIDPESTNQVDVKEVRSHTLFLPWNMFQEKSVASQQNSKNNQQHKSKQHRSNNKSDDDLNGSQDEDEAERQGVNLRLSSVEQTAAAAAQAHAHAATPATPAASTPMNIPPKALQIEQTVYASSAMAILTHRSKDRSKETRAALVEARRAKKEALRSRAKMRRMERRMEREAQGLPGRDPNDSDDQTTEESSSEEEPEDILDSDDEHLLSEREEDEKRMDEDFDYELERKRQEQQKRKREGGFGEGEEFFSSHSPSNDRKRFSSAAASNSTPRSPTKGGLFSSAAVFGGESDEQSSRPGTARGAHNPHAPARKSTMLTRKLTHKLASTPINHSLAEAFAHGLFQQTPEGLIGSVGASMPQPAFRTSATSLV